MKTLEKGQDRVKHICDVLRQNTLEPAKEQAEQIVVDAHAEAEKIIKEAESVAKKKIKAAKDAIAQEENVFQASLRQACKQGLEEMRQAVEKKIFNDSLSDFVKAGSQDVNIIANLLSAIVKAIETKGIDIEISAIIPKVASPRTINNLLLTKILERLKDESVEVGNFEGGAMVRLHDKQLTLDVSDAALKELLGGYLRKDFRKVMFKS